MRSCALSMRKQYQYLFYHYEYLHGYVERLGAHQESFCRVEASGQGVKISLPWLSRLSRLSQPSLDTTEKALNLRHNLVEVIYPQSPVGVRSSRNSTAEALRRLEFTTGKA